MFTSAIAALGERFSIQRPVRARNVVIHAAASVAASAIVAFVDAVVNSWIRPSGASLLRSTANWFLGGLPATTLAYFAILGVTYALRSNARLRERERHAAEVESQLRQAQLGALRMQLQPHFLFNSLNAIMALVRDAETARAVRALSLLSDVLRATVNAGDRHESTLADELEFVRRYLEIERVRFGDRLHVTFDVPERLLAALVPTFVLQPFVENSLKHGVLRARAGNAIIISARESGDTLTLVVRDDGRGLGPATEQGGVGIRNARERLDRMYGERARVTVENTRGAAGVVVEVALPLVTHPPLARTTAG
jgi:LytS/YehU family sensor histidine kinase